MNYITAKQARELGAGNAEYFQGSEGWMVCDPFCYYAEGYKYRAIKQAQPEPHAKLRAEYAKQVAEGTTGFYLWEFMTATNPSVWQQKTTGDEPDWTATTQYRAIKQAQPEPQYRKIEGVDHDPRYEPVDPHAALRAEYAKQVEEGTTGFYLWEVLEGDTWKKRDSINNFYPVLKYRFTDISCIVRKDGEPAVRMLKTEAQELQRNIFDFDCGGTYNYHTKATIKLDGKRVTPEQAAAEWKAKKETHDFWASFRGEEYIQVEYDGLLPVNYSATYELRPKQPAWTGSREDVIALLKEKGLL